MAGLLGGSLVSMAIGGVFLLTQIPPLTANREKASPESNAQPYKLPPQVVQYRIVSESISSWHGVPNKKRLVDVALADRVAEVDLIKIAEKIISSAGKSYGYTSISFRLPDYKGVGWAMADLLLKGDPGAADIGKIKVKFQGLTLEEMTALSKVKTPPVALGKVLGVWMDTRVPPGEKIQLVKEDDQLMITHTPAGSTQSREYEMISKKVEEGTRIDDKEANTFGEYYIINANGDLEFWSRNGNFYTAKKF